MLPGAVAAHMSDDCLSGPFIPSVSHQIDRREMIVASNGMHFSRGLVAICFSTHACHPSFHGFFLCLCSATPSEAASASHTADATPSETHTPDVTPTATASKTENYSESAT